MLDVRRLTVGYTTRQGSFDAVTDVSFTVDAGEYLGIVGESGCGKTTVLKAVTGILPENAEVRGGDVQFGGRSLLQLSQRERRRVQWDQISLVPQSAMNALNPVACLGDQLVEAIRTHSDVSRSEARARASECFRLVGLGPSRLNEFPHEFSGGMRQRAAIAMALVLDPDVVVCDEPTTGLDVIMQDQVLATLKSLQADGGRSLVLVTHNIAAVAENCDRVVVMYAGQVVEHGATREVLTEPFNPYTLGLRNAFPSMRSSRVDDLVTIPGAPPSLGEIGKGCRFAARCPFAEERCRREAPPLVEVAPGHTSRCHFPDRVERFRAVARDPQTWLAVASAAPEGPSTAMTEPSATAGTSPAASASASTADTDTQLAPSERAAHLACEQLRVYFPMRQSMIASLRGSRTPHLHAVDGVDVELMPGRALGLAGESGCGKSTTGMSIAGLVPPTGGAVRLGGEALDLAKRGDRRAYSRDVQVVFQDPYGSLNPRFTVGRTVEEPLRVHRFGNATQRRDRVLRALELAELRPARRYIDRYPHQLSGGQRQRISIARALVLEPRFLIADEPVSMLDVSVRAGVLRLLRHLIDDLGLGLLYVSHDLSTMPVVCDELAVMYMGRIVEHGPTGEVLGTPRHPYTRALISAVPSPDPRVQRVRDPLEGDVPSPVDPPPGCRFASRCPSARDECRAADPPLARVGGSKVWCVLHGPGGESGENHRTTTERSTT